MPVVATLALLLWLRPRTEVANEPAIAIKGGPSLRVFARRQGRVTAVRPRTTLHAGDEIRFAVEPAGLHYLIVASVDGAGKATVYFPYGGIASQPVSGGTLPGSIVLDDAPGPERIFALFSRQPLAAAEVTGALVELGRRGPDAIRAARQLSVAATQLSLVFEKVP
jgi:hypothetical protein